VGCAYSEKIVFPEFFADNPDSWVPQYQTPNQRRCPAARMASAVLQVVLDLAEVRIRIAVVHRLIQPGLQTSPILTRL
jgi:hypothetical protein